MKIAIASCAKLKDIKPQPVWDDIRLAKPDVLLLLGDTVYMREEKNKTPEALRADLRARYAEQRSDPHFAALCKDINDRGKTLLAVYDDHDFLGNDRCGGDEPAALREAARDEFIHMFSPALTGSDVYRLVRSDLVDIIVLDARFYRKSPSVSKNDPDAMLGAQQWTWLEGAVASAAAPYLVVASSSNFHKLDLIRPDSWEKYPAAASRLRNLLNEARGKVMIVSGDIHENNMSDKNGIIEVVSSGVSRKNVITGNLPIPFIEKRLRNYGVLTFSPDSVRVELKGLKAKNRFDVMISRDRWRL